MIEYKHKMMMLIKNVKIIAKESSEVYGYIGKHSDDTREWGEGLNYMQIIQESVLKIIHLFERYEKAKEAFGDGVDAPSYLKLMWNQQINLLEASANLTILRTRVRDRNERCTEDIANSRK